MLYYFFEEREQGAKNTVVVSFPLPLDGNKYIYMTIANILSKGCRRYKTKADLEYKCKELDEVKIFNEWKVEGDRIFLNFYLSFKKEKSEDEKREILELFLLYINENLVVDGAFKESYFKEAKNEVLELIEFRKNEPLNWGKEKIIGILQHGFLYGEIEENRLYKMNTISNIDVLKLWFDLKNNTSPIIQVCGEVELEIVTKEVLSKFMRINRIIPTKARRLDEEYRETEEHYKGEKSILIACLKSEFNIINYLEKVMVPYSILFGRKNSRLNEVLKEKGIEGEVYSNLDYSNGVISLEYIGKENNIQIVLDTLKNELEAVKKNDFDEKDVLGSINKSLTLVDKIIEDDYNYSMFLIMGKCKDRNFNLNIIKNRIKDFTLKDVEEGFQNMKLVSVMKIFGGNKREII